MIPTYKLKKWLDKFSFKQKLQVVAFGAGGILLILAILLYMGGSRTLGGSFFIAGLVVAALPYGLYTYFHDKKYREMERELPAFLRNLSESIKSGMSLPQAFQQAAKTDYGKLDEEIERAEHQLSWGVPFPEVMERMASRIEGSGLIRRSIYIILQSYQSGGNIAETLDAIAASAARIKDAEQEKKAVLKQQVYIIYAIHFLFIAILLALFVLLDSFLLNLTGGSSGGSSASAGFAGGGFGGLGNVQNFCREAIAQPICELCRIFGLEDIEAARGSGGGGGTLPKICYYKGLFLLMIVVSGVFNGLVAGEVVEGKVSSGVKHALIMAPLGFIIYLVAITQIIPAL